VPATDLEDRLRQVLAQALDQDDVALKDLHRLSGGASRETWSFDAVLADGSLLPLVLRRDPPSAPKGNMALEAALISAAAAAGVPVPGLLTASDNREVLGSSFMVVDRLEGETIPRRILREPELAAARAGLARQCGQILAHLHSIPATAVPGLPEGDPLQQYRQTLDALGGGSPTFEIGFRWLEENRPGEVSEPRVVHGDFRNGNLIVGPDGVRAVLDWELAHAGDPMEDLGWLCAKSWRFGVDLPVGGFGTYDDLVAGYESSGGHPVDRGALRWWEVFANLRWGIICMMQASAHTSGMIRSVELAAIGRRVCEVEWDLLELLAGPDRGLTDPDQLPAPETGEESVARPGGAYLHGSPDAAGLLEAVREFLEKDVMEATDGRVRFHTRVAVNVVGMVERELRLGPALARSHDAGLLSLGVSDEADLAAAVRTGRLALDDPGLWGVVAASVRDRLAVANPRYLDGPEAPQ
jgi:aminoglycoside phosphotransferase (APT) family kinase protein